MSRLRSLIIHAEVDTAKKAHDCRSNHRHRIESGDRRLKVRNGRSWQHYCFECAKAIVRNGISTLEVLASTLETDRALMYEQSHVESPTIVAGSVEPEPDTPAPKPPLVHGVQ